MRIFHKLLIAFIFISLMFVLFGYFSIEVSRRALRGSTGENMMLVADGLARMLGMELHGKITAFEVYTKDVLLANALSGSNRAFERVGDVKAYIDARDAAWRATPLNEITPLMDELMENDLAEEIREKIGGYNERHCCPYAGVLVTNRFGAVIAMSNRTTGYRQDDETWWREARDKGMYISDVEFDESSGVQSISAGIRIDDKNGGFQGVLKVVIDLANVLGAIREHGLKEIGSTIGYKLLTSNGKVLYSSEDYAFLEDVSGKAFFRFIKGESGFFDAEGGQPGEADEFFAYSRLTGHQDMTGFDWVILIERPKKETYAPVQNIKWILLMLMVSGAFIALILSYLFSRSVARPVERLGAAAIEFGKGRLDTRVEFKSKDELGSLAGTFNAMAENLKQTILSRENEIIVRKNMETQLKHQANFDSLTGLPNRSLFIRRLTRAIKQKNDNEGYDFAVLFMDLDRFKNINDSLGHTIGDSLLVEVAGRLQSCVRPEDMAARLGGDEFALFIDRIKAAHEASHVADRVQRALEEEFDLQGHKVFTTASFGIALSTAQYSRAEDMIRDSDTAMYRAKSRGKSRYEVFDTTMHALVTRHLELEADLRRAIANNELYVKYQPILSLKTGEMTSVEALLRWKHRTLGDISPVEFIPIAEETGLILPIGDWVLKEACAQNNRWHEKGLRRLRVNVNFSIRQFQHQDLTETVRTALRATGLSAGFLNIEITESVVMDSRAIELLKETHALGVKNAIDDFGTGYSSLSVLTRLPIDSVKIDKAFIDYAGTDPQAQAIVRTIIVMAHSLGITVVAEGVEKEEQLDFLRANGCDEVQGYLISRPTDDKGIEELFEKGAYIDRFTGDKKA